ncbi:iron transporter [Candidatus Bathyarchaeota archaeon]|nr:MAG: iron transporter [Candidatus Bathyarchaeota archaeon]RLI28996.1 MAG: iron transporter [Candidatus Bathyarchaeota archaeon]
MEKRLSELQPGERGVITRIEGSGATVRRMLDMGLVKGTEITVIRKAPLGDPVEFLLKGYNLSLRRKESEHVYVRVEEGGTK